MYEISCIKQFSILWHTHENIVFLLHISIHILYFYIITLTVYFFNLDVDTHEPDEKSLITYISSLHEVFPEPPPIHPLYDSVSQQRMQEYREIASSLHMWMREKYSLMQVSQIYIYTFKC